MAITSPKAPICPLLTHSASGILASTTHTRTCAWAQWTGTEMITPKVWYLKALRPAKAVMPRPPGALAKLSAVPRPLLQNCFVPGGLGGLSKGGVNCVCCVSPLCVCHAGALPRGDESIYCIPPCTSPAWGVLPACPPRDLGQPGRCRAFGGPAGSTGEGTTSNAPRAPAQGITNTLQHVANYQGVPGLRGGKVTKNS